MHSCIRICPKRLWNYGWRSRVRYRFSFFLLLCLLLLNLTFFSGCEWPYMPHSIILGFFIGRKVLSKFQLHCFSTFGDVNTSLGCFMKTSMADILDFGLECLKQIQVSSQLGKCLPNFNFIAAVVSGMKLTHAGQTGHGIGTPDFVR